MKINLEVFHSCTIKRKKPWPKISWIGRQKEQLFILDSQRMSIVDPKNGKTKRRVGKIKGHIKSLIAYTISDNGLYLVGVLKTGDLIIWNKDQGEVLHVDGMSEFAFKLGFHCPSVYISDDMRKILLITSRNKVFVWEADRIAAQQLSGNWSIVVASKDIKTVEDNKELVLHARFSLSPVNGASALCCFAFNYENNLIVNVLKIKWLSPNEINSIGECRFRTLWMCYQPNIFKYNDSISFNSMGTSQNKINCLYTRGAYVLKLSHSSALLALACNQKYVEHGCLLFMSPTNGSTTPVNLRNFGLNAQARGRHYWIQDVCWMYNDLYLAGITKHGAIFLVSRLGHPLFIHAIGKDINMGPALFLTIHPLIIVRGKSASISQNKSGDGSMSSTLETEDPQRQRYSISRHPTLPMFVCSDGFLMCVFKIQTAYSTQPRLIRELLHKTIGLLNSVGNTIERKQTDSSKKYQLHDPFDYKKLPAKKGLASIKSHRHHQNDDDDYIDEEKQIPDWSFETGTTNDANLNQQQSDKSSDDSGVDSNDGVPRAAAMRRESQEKIAEGKIIFSFLPQIIPISMETLDSSSTASKMELAFEHLQASWSLLVSTPTWHALLDTYECDQTAKAVQQAFTHFSHLFLNLDSDSLRQLQIYQNEFKKHPSTAESESSMSESALEEDFKLKVVVDLYIKMIKYLYFDQASKLNPISHMISYIGRFVEKFMQSLLKYDSLMVDATRTSKLNLFGLVYTLINYTESLVKSIYNVHCSTTSTLFLCSDSVQTQPSLDESKPVNNSNETNKIGQAPVIDEKNQEQDTISIDTTHKHQQNLLIKQQETQTFEFVDLMFEKCWFNLLHYVNKHRRAIEMFADRRSSSTSHNRLNLFLLLVERRLNAYPRIVKSIVDPRTGASLVKYRPINTRPHRLHINRGDLIYLDYGDVQTALIEWQKQLADLFARLDTLTRTDKVIYLTQKLQHNNEIERIRRRSIKIAHKIFYACLAHYQLDKLLNIINSYLTNSSFSLYLNAFRYLDPPRSLPKYPVAIVSVLKSLARFMAGYLTNTRGGLFICSVNRALEMPSILSSSNGDQFNVELSRPRFTAEINKQHLNEFFTVDKTVELLLVTGLFAEAVHFLNSINDWRSSFLIGSILTESEQILLPNDIQPSQALMKKIQPLFDMNNPAINLKLIERDYMDNVSRLLDELLLASVVTRSNIVEPLIGSMIELLVKNVHELCANSGSIVPAEFYLPAPPVYLTQMESESTEAGHRVKISILCRSLIMLFKTSRLHVALIKWYLTSLDDAGQQMRNTFGVRNVFALNVSLKNLLVALKFQRISYIPDRVLMLFRDFCAVVFFLDVRDRFSYELRQYTKNLMELSSKNHDRYSTSLIDGDSVRMSLDLVDYANLMLSFRGFLTEREHYEIQDLVVSILSKLTRHPQRLELGLEHRLSACASKQPLRTIDPDNGDDRHNEPVVQHVISRAYAFSGETFDVKLAKLVDEWKGIRLSNVETSTMADMFEQCSQNVTTNAKLKSHYGLNEDTLVRVYMQKLTPIEPSQCGGYDFERTWPRLSEFLEMFFKFGFDQTDSWESLSACVNQTPLLPEFYDTIVEREFAQPDVATLDKAHLMPSLKPAAAPQDTDDYSMLTKRKNRNKKSLVDELNLEDYSLDTRKGLLRTYSLTRMNQTQPADKLTSKSLSFSNFTQLETSSSSMSNVQHNPLKVLDYGAEYVRTSNIAIWLMKWSSKFQRIIIQNNSHADGTNMTALKMHKLTANLLVGSVFLSNGNDLTSSANRPEPKRAKKSPTKSFTQINDEEFTQVSSSEASSDKKTNSSTLDISSLTDNQIKNFFTSTEQVQIGEFVEQRKNDITRPASSLNRTREELNETNSFQPTEQPPNTTLDNTTAHQSTQLIIEDGNNLNESRKIGTVESLANWSIRPRSQTATSRSQSPKSGRSKSPLKQPSKVEPVGDFFSTPQPQQIAPFPAPITDVHDLIRNEFKKIIQIQHDTVMNFLNGSPATHQIPMMPVQAQPIGFNAMDQQIASVLRQRTQGAGPVEFVVETKIKAVGGAVDQTNQNLSMFSSSMPLVNPPAPFATPAAPVQPVVGQYEFMRTFEAASSTTVSAKTQSNLIKIPLLNSQYVHSSKHAHHERVSLSPERAHVKLPLLETKLDRHAPEATKKHVDIPLINFKSERNHDQHQHDVNTTGRKMPTLLNLTTTETIHRSVVVTADSQTAAPKPINKHLREFIEMSKKTPTPTADNVGKNFPLLKLNYTREEVTIRPAIEPTQVDRPSRERKKTKKPAAITQETKQVETQKPLYDGYILAPDAVKDMLNEPDMSNFISSASAHYDATKHLRQEAKMSTSANKKDSSTMTGDIPNVANVIPPDILFKLKFDDPTEGNSRDYVNVVDLDSQAVEDLLKLIEHEQDKRKPVVTIEPSARKEEKEEATTHRPEDEEAQTPAAPQADRLTEKLLNYTKTEDEWRDYDKAMSDQINEATNLARSDINKQQMINELRFIDEKIRLINEMATEMTGDYTKYDKITKKLDDLVSDRHLIEKYQAQREQARQEEERRRTAAAKSEQELKFYRPDEAADQIEDLKKRVSTPGKVPDVQRRLKKPAAKTTIADLLEQEELSDLRDDEKAKLKELLNSKDSTLHMSDTGNSISDVMREVLDDLHVERADDIDESNLDEILDRSSSPSKYKSKSKSKSPIRPVSNVISNRKTPKTTVSPVRRARKDVKPTRPMNRTYEKVERKTSPIVKKEIEMQTRREQMKEQFTKQREEEAKHLMSDILIDTAEFDSTIRSVPQHSPTETKKKTSSTSPPSKKPTSVSRSPPAVRRQVVPKLELNSHSKPPDLLTSQMSMQNKKPGLMTKTILDLQRKDSLRRGENEHLLKELEMRFTSKDDNRPTNAPTKRIKSFASMVRLQDPSKLRRRTENKPLSYNEQLMALQESTVVPQTSATSVNEMVKLYGSHRVRGMNESTCSGRKTNRQTKTYSQRLKELRPAQSQVTTANRRPPVRMQNPITSSTRAPHNAKTYTDQLKNLQKNNTVHVGKHDLTTKKRMDKADARFKPYDVTANIRDYEELDDLSDWSLDDNLKNIIYDENEPKKTPKKQPPALKGPKKAQKHVTYKPQVTNDTLNMSDSVDTLAKLLEDGRKNEHIYEKIMNDLNELDKGKQANYRSKDHDDDDQDDEDYTNKVNLDDLKNISLSSESALGEFIDWDQIDNLINTLN